MMIFNLSKKPPPKEPHPSLPLNNRHCASCFTHYPIPTFQTFLGFATFTGREHSNPRFAHTSQLTCFNQNSQIIAPGLMKNTEAATPFCRKEYDAALWARFSIHLNNDTTLSQNLLSQSSGYETISRLPDCLFLRAFSKFRHRSVQCFHHGERRYFHHHLHR